MSPFSAGWQESVKKPGVCEAIEVLFSHYFVGEQSFPGRTKHEGGSAGGPNEHCSPGNPKPLQKELLCVASGCDGSPACSLC
jgi:hypothetical protein